MIPDLAIVDLGLGNLRSVEKAVALAAERASTGVPVVTHDPELIARATRVVVPGQGAFRDGAAALAKDGGALHQALRETIARGTPYLGICLGLQLLLDDSEEAPGAAGLGVFAGSVRRIPDDLVFEGRRLKVPHMGWNQPHLLENEAGAAARDALPSGDWFYFVPIAVLVWLALMVTAMVLADRQRTPRCSDPDCRAPIPTGPAIALTTSLTCPGCGGTIVGDIQHAEQRLAATEALAQPTTRPTPTTPRHARPLVIAMPTATHNPDPE